MRIERLVLAENVPRHHLEGGADRLVDLGGIHGAPEVTQARHGLHLGRQVGQVKVDQPNAHGRRRWRSQLLHNGGQLLDGAVLDLSTSATPCAIPIDRVGLFQGAVDIAVVHDQSAFLLVVVDAVGTGDGLHEGVALQRLVEVDCRDTLGIKACDPHGTHDDQPEVVVGILELRLRSRSTIFLRWGSMFSCSFRKVSTSFCSLLTTTHTSVASALSKCACNSLSPQGLDRHRCGP